MAVATSHFFGLVAHELVDDPLVDFGGGKVGSERMTKDVEASNKVPIAIGHRLLSGDGEPAKR